MHSSEGEKVVGGEGPPHMHATVLREGKEMKLCIIFRRKLCLCISVIIKN